MKVAATHLQVAATHVQPSEGGRGCSANPVAARVSANCNPLQPIFLPILVKKKERSSRGVEKYKGINRESGLQRVAGLQQSAKFDELAYPHRRFDEGESRLKRISTRVHARVENSADKCHLQHPAPVLLHQVAVALRRPRLYLV
jgi:hypothetical protein